MTHIHHVHVFALLLVAGLAGCHQTPRYGDVRDIPMGTHRDPNEISSERSIGAQVVSPFIVKLIKKAKQAAGREGFDPDLPGYHLVGDIATIQLIPTANRSSPLVEKKPVTELLFRIQTSPGMPPNVENLTIKTQGLLLSMALSRGNDGKGVIEVYDLLQVPRGPPKVVPQADFISLKVVGDAVELRLLPSAMELLKDGGEINWIDWYRG